MLQVFYLNVAYVLQWFSSVFQVFFATVSDACFKCFICLQPYVASVVSRCFESRSGVASPSYFILPHLSFSSSFGHWLGIRRPLPHFSMRVTFGVMQALRRHARRGRKQTASASVRTPCPITPSVLHPKSFTKTCHEHHTCVLKHVVK